MRREPTPIAGLVRLHSERFSDARGHFTVAWRSEDLAGLEGFSPFVQESLSVSKPGVLRGLHLQRTAPQGKLVRAVAGRIFDVAVDLRAASPTCGQAVATPLSAESGQAVWIPPGFAHGFCALSPATVLYQVTAPWTPEGELTIAWDDPDLRIPWPLTAPPLLSPRDRAAPSLAEVLSLLTGHS